MDYPSAIFPSSNFFLFSLFIILSTSTLSLSAVPTISYSDHCAHMVPEAARTTPVYTVYPFLEPETSHYSGGERILGKNNSSYPGYYHYQKSLYFAATNNIFKTSIDGLYEIEAHLIFQTPYVFHVPSNSTPNWLSNNKRHRRRMSSLDFLLNGFWSVSSNKLCMVGSAPWYSREGKLLNLEAVLKLNFARNLTVYTSLISGVLESLATSSNDPSYFEPISIVGFPRVTPHKYNYSLVSEEGCSGGNIPPNSSLSLKGMSICAMFSRRYSTYKLQYPSECNSSKFCTPLDGATGNFTSLLSLYAIQCSESEKKLRYLVGFPKSSYLGYWSTFDPSTALIGEGIWDGKNNQLCIVVCRILNQDDPLGNAHPGNCSIRLNLRYQAVWSIKNSIIAQGEIWSNKTTKDVGYFERIKFQSTDDGKVTLPGLKYEYTEIERVTKSCPVKKPIEDKGERYPDGHSYSLRFDLSVKHSERNLAWGYADPISVGSQLYDQYTRIMTESRHGYAAAEELVPEVAVVDARSVPLVGAATHYTGPMNISYKISFRPTTGIKLGNGISSLNASLGHYGQVEISAEGVYDNSTGHLCMVGCRRLISNEQESFDCEILVKMQFPAESGTNTQGLIMGSVESTRNKDDSLYFERLDISSTAITSDAARRTIWKMDLEIIMVLLSNTLECVFVGLQLLHVKRQFHVLPSISLFMLLILTLSHMIPLVLNFEALFMGHHDRKNLMLGSGGWLEVNEVFVRVVTMVVFVLEFRLFQLAWTAKFSDGNEKGAWIAEIKTLFVSLPLYIIGGSVALLVNWKRNKHYSMKQLSSVAVNQKHSLWGDISSYAGLVLDGFLLPQILLNIFQSSKGSSLSPSFYVGTSFVRLLPHAYDLYRGHNYIGHQFDRLYIYANPRADFYSPFWDVIVPCGGIVFVAIVAFQQHFGGRFFLPRRLRELEEYEMVPVVSS